MAGNHISLRTKKDEFEGEKLINKFRFVIAFLYVGVVVLFAVLRKIEGLEPFPVYGFFPNTFFLLFSIVLFFYLLKRKTLSPVFKYFCVIMDMTIISASIYIGCSYHHLDPPISYLSIWALFYSVLILLGAFRYSTRCAIFSGIYAGICYLIVIILRSNALDLPYFVEFEGAIISVSFPTLNESFRIISMFITGIITGIACKRQLKLFSGIIDTQAEMAKTASITVDKTHSMAETIRKSTDEIFLSSKNIYSIANNQAASIQEIEATMNENTQIAVEITEKTTNVSSIASQMENDVRNGFSILERNIGQLEEIKLKNDNVISGILALGNKIVKIRDIIETINAITDQTKVIAFNAALEAASAGEHGKRFSVVSSEVNRLADDIAALTKQIRKQADDIKGSSSSLIVSSKESAANIKEGNNLIKELENIFREIRSGAEVAAIKAQVITISSHKQQKSSEHINTAIMDISRGLSSFINSTKVATSSAEDLTKTMNELGNLLTVSADEREDA
ncbi:MAG: methyl-accepting chemotaxis protein [Treponema sp.]|nr:methyl-accepting chemotaxis protein [Treponema sp.]